MSSLLLFLIFHNFTCKHLICGNNCPIADSNWLVAWPANGIGFILCTIYISQSWKQSWEMRLICSFHCDVMIPHSKSQTLIQKHVHTQTYSGYLQDSFVQLWKLYYHCDRNCIKPANLVCENTLDDMFMSRFLPRLVTKKEINITVHWISLTCTFISQNLTKK